MRLILIYQCSTSGKSGACNKIDVNRSSNPCHSVRVPENIGNLII